MQAAANLAVDRAAAPHRNVITRLRSDPPLVFRPARHGALPLACGTGPGLAPPSHVWLTAGAAGPIGGDQLQLNVRVGVRAGLVLRGVAATIALPGPHGRPSQSGVNLRVEEGGFLAWLPGPLIAGKGCSHSANTRVTLERDCRLLLREELLLGRHGEMPGSVNQRVRVVLEGEPLYDQELAVGPAVPGWPGPAVVGGRRAVGSMLIVEPNLGRLRIPQSATGDCALMRLGDSALLVTAVAPDGLTLRQRLDGALRLLVPDIETTGRE